MMSSSGKDHGESSSSLSSDASSSSTTINASPFHQENEALRVQLENALKENEKADVKCETYEKLILDLMKMKMKI